jgi:hypothetical protein
VCEADVFIHINTTSLDEDFLHQPINYELAHTHSNHPRFHEHDRDFGQEGSETILNNFFEIRMIAVVVDVQEN